MPSESKFKNNVIGYDAVMATHTLMTAEQFDALPYDEERRLELLDGELIEIPNAAPLHSIVVVKVASSLESFLRRNRRGNVLINTDFAFNENRFRPDIAVLSASKWSQVNIERSPVRVAPDIVVEVVSPSEAASYLNRKIAVYRNNAVAETWVLYPDGPHVFIYAPQGIRELRDSDTLASPLLPGWSLPLAELLP